MDPLATALNELSAGRALSDAAAESAFGEVLAGRAGEARIGALLGMIAARPGGTTVDEVVGAARAMRAHAQPVERPRTGRYADAVMIDTCGTGGGPKLFNVSTIGALVAAAAGEGRVIVAKHGNVSRTGRGSAEVMRELGVKIDASPEVQTRCLGEVGVCFSLATAHHPAARHASPVRKALGFPTIFNLIGPLANPAGAERQVMGTWSHANARLLAGALARLGCERAMVFCSRDGLDELTVTDVNVVHEVGRIAEGAAAEREFDALEAGLPRRRIEELRAASLADAVRIARDVLGGVTGPCRDMALLNAGAALWIADAATSIAEGVRMSAEAIDSGAAAETLRGLVDLSNGR